VLRQLIALGHVRAEGEFNTLELTDSARRAARRVSLQLRVPPKRRARPRAAAPAADRERASRRRCRWTRRRRSASRR
jgi:ATP-dependent DNA helicase RecQ